MKVAVVGVGRWGENHVKVLKKLGRLNGIYDADFVRATSVAEKYGTFVYNSMDEINSRSVDAVVIATPATTHYDVAKFFIEKGIDMLIEKPPTTDLESIKKLYNLSKDKVKVGFGFIERFNPAFVSFEDCYRASYSIYFYRLATGSNIKDVGVVLDLMIHDIDLANHLFGEPKVLLKRVVREQDKDVTAEALIEYGNTRAHLISSWKSPSKFRKIFSFSDSAFVEADLAEKKGSCYRVANEPKLAEEKNADLLEAEHIQFEKFIKEGKSFPDIYDAVKDMEVAEEILH